MTDHTITWILILPKYPIEIILTGYYGTYFLLSLRNLKSICEDLRCILSASSAGKPYSAFVSFSAFSANCKASKKSWIPPFITASKL